MMALVPIADLVVGDVMWDPAGNLRVDRVRTLDDGRIEVAVVAVDGGSEAEWGGFEAAWTFDPADLARVDR